MAQTTAVRGHAISFRGDPFFVDDALVDVEDALIVSSDGVITAFGPYAELRDQVPDGVEVVHYPDALICAGFVDTHIHYVQTGIIGAFGSQLIDWLNNYTFIEEQAFADKAHADAVAKLYFDQLLANGTTTAVTFAAVYPGSADAFFEESQRRGTRMIGGKVLMDRNAPERLLDTAQSGYDDSKALIARWHGNGRNMYAITPRFAPTSTPAQLELAGALWKESPGTFIHTHVSENVGEIQWVRQLFPDRAGYLDVYDHFGLLGRRAVLAHGVHLTARERHRVHETGSAVAHCPTSNLFLGSGLFHVHAAKDPKRPMHVGLGTDIGAGTSFSLLQTMNEAYKVAELNAYPLDAQKSFFLATRGGAEALDLADRIGSLDVGMEADFVVLDTQATPLLAYRSERAKDTEELMFVLSIMADDRAVAATYVAGAPAYQRSV
ncbi:guanine deaminase [Conexibacter sp. JD483]|uniref:guanine deaminase n=1 Tax=unclassified Conexibacter TaxID=2627773 RepID=UPI00271C57B4|nr:MULTISPECIES: guanine deaminase [unclassified Conexibacter]MDO8188616.1 guanine deaminase [Conexibacter sp. CPCC 205706]MDO8201506.1 guanine deaminase [Conexibacter sp. CPCC 205762]MDR9370873.1 guanine deaminase [Conexibacter sp. JD483]